ncbi:MAG: TauD/TfdA family dioxygenase [Alphaproteobacteria bacterium]
MLEFLFNHSEKHEFIYQHEWQIGDLVMWDNRCLNHARTDFPREERRLLRRNVIQGVRPERGRIDAAA